jgi:6,7-dimethyl-8-ribityllumazine synthase
MSSHSASGYKIAIVISKFNEVITDSLLEGAKKSFFNAGGKESNISIYTVPGAFEIPATVKQVLDNEQPHAIVTLGAVIRGGTPHFDYVAGECARGVMDLSMNSNIPILFGVLTTDNLQQALGRSGDGTANKGWEVMDAAIQTIATYKDIQS